MTWNSGRASRTLFSMPQDEVDVEAALVRLVHHDDAVAREGAVELHLLEQYAVGHDLDHRCIVGPVLEAHRVADEYRGWSCRAAGR